MRLIEETQRILWNWFSEEIHNIEGPIDRLICNGDMIDGKGDKSGGIELFTSNRLTQCDVAVDVIKEVGATRVAIIRGTPYHTGKDEPWEDVLARLVDADIVASKATFDFDGINVDVRHKIGSSSIPHGRYTAMGRELLWNTLKAEMGVVHKADIVIRSHVHYCVFCGTSRQIGMTCPGLQLITKFGEEEVSGSIDVGFLEIRAEDGVKQCIPHILDLGFTLRPAITA
jgi:hypothetical protein